MTHSQFGLKQSQKIRGMERRIRLLKFLVVALILLLGLVVARPVKADEPHLEVSALRIQSYTRNFPDVSERLFEQRGLWGGEARARFPKGKFALIGRLYTEGAAGAHSFRDPGTWHRAVLEGALSYRVLELEVGAERYSVAVMAGAGVSDDLERARNFEHIDDEANELAGPPPKYGAGVHIRSEPGNWLNLRAEWDDAVGGGASWCGGCFLAGTFHLPVFGKRGGLGVDATLGSFSKVQVMAKLKLWEWKPKKAAPPSE